MLGLKLIHVSKRGHWSPVSVSQQTRLIAPYRALTQISGSVHPIRYIKNHFALCFLVASSFTESVWCICYPYLKLLPPSPCSRPQTHLLSSVISLGFGRTWNRDDTLYCRLRQSLCSIRTHGHINGLWAESAVYLLSTILDVVHCADRHITEE